MNNSTSCAPVLYIAPENVVEVANRLYAFAEDYKDGMENYENIGNVISNKSESRVFSIPEIKLDISDTRSEKIHTFDSAALLLIMALLFLTVITIWVFKARRLRVLHETGLSLLYGMSMSPFAAHSVKGGVFLIRTHYGIR